MSKIHGHREPQGAGHAADDVAGRIGDPVSIVSQVRDAGAEGGWPPGERGRVACADIEGHPARDVLEVIGTDIGFAGVDGARGCREPGQERRVPLDTEVALQGGRADGVIAVIDVTRRAGEPGVEVGHATEDTHAGRHLAERVQLDAAIPLLAVEAEDLGDGVGDAARHVDLEGGERDADTAQIELGADLILLALERREHLRRIGGAGRRRRAGRETFDIAGVDRQLPDRPDHQGHRGRGRAVVEMGGRHAGDGGEAA